MEKRGRLFYPAPPSMHAWRLHLVALVPVHPLGFPGSSMILLSPSQPRLLLVRQRRSTPPPNRRPSSIQARAAERCQWRCQAPIPALEIFPHSTLRFSLSYGEEGALPWWHRSEWLFLVRFEAPSPLQSSLLAFLGQGSPRQQTVPLQSN
jgi:hypothetical protein